ncbi:unnamed protein product [Eruca vesicaria subsp. sativa]|uniref:Pentatricopeptide repeat-containing protein n=1 Tax=Eruca vesicaria subsp. sativa TaxID=29727 RepID=A0ABC8K7P9_ERUVS|nr:unnamed protein product [Eruca vesicaria subsp. sativa]
MPLKRVPLNCYVKTTLLDIYAIAKCKDILSARRNFNELGLERNLVTWNAMISGYTRIEWEDIELGDWIVDYIAKNQMKLSVSGYRSLMFMHARCGNLSEAKRVLEEMNDRDIVSYNTLISAFAAKGDGAETLKLFLKMEEEGIEPDPVTYIGALTACSRSGLLEERPENIRVNKKPHYSCMYDLLG